MRRRIVVLLSLSLLTICCMMALVAAGSKNSSDRMVGIEFWPAAVIKGDQGLLRDGDCIILADGKQAPAVEILKAAEKPELLLIRQGIRMSLKATVTNAIRAVVVSKVYESASRTLQPGQVLVGINGRGFSSPEEVQEIVRTSKGEFIQVQTLDEDIVAQTMPRSDDLNPTSVGVRSALATGTGDPGDCIFVIYNACCGGQYCYTTRALLGCGWISGSNPYQCCAVWVV